MAWRTFPFSREEQGATTERAWPELLKVLALLVVLLLVWWIGGFWFYRRYIAALYIGALVGASELVARYRDSPERALWTIPATLYVLINAAASTTAMYVVTRFE